MLQPTSGRGHFVYTATACCWRRISM